MSEIIDPKEKLLLEFIISSVPLYIKVIGVVKSEYFDEPLDRVVDFLMEYYHKYKNIPDVDMIYAETKVKLEHRDVGDSEFEYVSDEIEKHCRNSAMRLAILKSAEIVNDDDECENYGEIFDAVRDVLMISVDKDIGTDQFCDVAVRHAMMQQYIDSRSIGWPSLDRLLDNVRRGEIVIFAGNSGSGKSVTLSNIAANMSKQGLNCLIISLELNEAMISKRLDAIMTGVSIKKVFDETTTIQMTYDGYGDEVGSVYTKKMQNGCNSNDIRAYLMEYSLQFGHHPDVICVDYLDLMQPINPKQHQSEGVFGKDKAITEELREIFDEYNAYGFSASQLNRDAVDQAHKSQSHIAGGISKINTSDATIAISRTEEQLDNGQVEFQGIKLRNAEMSNYPVVLYWNDRNLQITEQPALAGVASLQPEEGQTTQAPLPDALVTKKDKIKALLAKSKKIK